MNFQKLERLEQKIRALKVGVKFSFGPLPRLNHEGKIDSSEIDLNFDFEIIRNTINGPATATNQN